MLRFRRSSLFLDTFPYLPHALFEAHAPSRAFHRLSNQHTSSALHNNNLHLNLTPQPPFPPAPHAKTNLALPPAAHADLILTEHVCVAAQAYAAHTTCSEALFAGLPVLTRPGQTFASRVPASLLHALGCSQTLRVSTDGSHSVSYTHLTLPTICSV
eukprot:3576096-Rhodomonas_salina.1